jgi:hypothetical protein
VEKNKMAKLVCYMDYQNNDKKKHYRVRVVDLNSNWGIDKSISFKDKKDATRVKEFIDNKILPLVA